MQYTPKKEALKPLLEALEAKRKVYLEYRKAAKRWYGMPLGILIFFLLNSLVYEIPLLLCFMLCIGIGLFIKFKKVKPYVEQYNVLYKETFVKPFVSIFYPQLKYLPGKFSTSNTMETSLLFKALDFDNGLSCEDGFRGKTAQGLDFTMMEVSYELEQQREKEIKRAFFVSIALPNKGYRPLVLAKKSVIKPILEAYNRKESSKEAIFEQAEFETYFGSQYAVYSPQKESARALLTIPFLALIQELKEQWIEDICFSLLDDAFHIALSPQTNFFEADLEQTVLADTIGKELFEQLSTYLSTVEELSASLSQLNLPSQEKIPLPKDLDLPKENWGDDAYDHFIDN